MPLVTVSSLCFVFSAASFLVGRLQWDFPLPPLTFSFQFQPSSLIFFSSTACLGPLTDFLERHQFVIRGTGTGESKTGPAVPSSLHGDTAGFCCVTHQNHHEFFLWPAPTGLQWMNSKPQCRILFTEVLGSSCQRFSCQSVFHLTAGPLKRSPALVNIHRSF